MGETGTQKGVRANLSSAHRSGAGFSNRRVSVAASTTSRSSAAGSFASRARVGIARWLIRSTRGCTAYITAQASMARVAPVPRTQHVLHPGAHPVSVSRRWAKLDTHSLRRGARDEYRRSNSRTRLGHSEWRCIRSAGAAFIRTSPRAVLFPGAVSAADAFRACCDTTARRQDHGSCRRAQARTRAPLD